jgi:hypothetical protein
MRRRTVLSAALTAAALSAALPAPAAAGSVVLRTRFDLSAVALDGDHVAYVVSGPGCQRVELLPLRDGSVVRLSGGGAAFCEGAFGGQASSLQEPYFGRFLALAGTRAYWVFAANGNFLYQSLQTGAPGTRARTVVPLATADRDTGPFLGPLAAAGSTLAYSRYGVTRTCVGTVCTSSRPEHTTLTLRGHRVALPAAGVVTSVDAGRAVVALSDGRVAIVRVGRPAVVAATGTASVVDAALGGRRLVVVVRDRLLVFDAASGRLHAAYALPGARTVDVWHGVAAVTAGQRLYAVNLANGHRRLVAQLGRTRAFVGAAQIDAGRIVWATHRAAPLWPGSRMLSLVVAASVPRVH